MLDLTQKSCWERRGVPCMRNRSKPSRLRWRRPWRSSHCPLLRTSGRRWSCCAPRAGRRSWPSCFPSGGGWSAARCWSCAPPSCPSCPLPRRTAGCPSVTAISAASSTRRGTLPRTGRSTPVEPAFISRSSRCCWIRSAGHCPSILWRTFTFWRRRSILPATAPGSMSGF